MATYSRAGQFGPAAIPGVPPGASLRVVDAAGSDALIYADASKNKTVAPVVTVPESGLVSFFADPAVYTVRWFGGSAQVTVSGGTVDASTDPGTAANVSRPGDYGWLTWTQDVRTVSTTSAAPVSGTLYLMRVPMRTPAPIGGAAFVVPTTAGTPTTVEVSLWTSDGVRRAVSANANTAFGSSGAKQVPFTASYTPPNDSSWLWVGFLAVGASLPNLVRASSVSVQVLNPNVSLSSGMFAVAGTGLTSTPASVVPSSLVAPASGEGWWASLY